MPTLKQALGAMPSIPQFIVWKLTWDDAENKYKKHPVNVTDTSIPVSGADPANWMTYDLALQWVDHLTSQGGVWALGFYFSKNCGYWFLDIDKALDDEQQMTPTATHIYSVLAGAGCAFEWSSSGKGFHMFGKGTLTSERQIKPSGTGLELYTEGRGVAFGLTGEAVGCADTDANVQMHATIIPTYFPPKATVKQENTDFSQPRADYYCISDDEELLQRMLRSGSVQSQFDVNKPIFSDLWNNKREILDLYYGADESAHDMALAQHLAFWTGCDAPRMEIFMRRSALMRDKWDIHKTYLMDFTITNACLGQENVLHDEPSTMLNDKGETVLIEDGSHFAGIMEQKILFKGSVYIRDLKKFYRPLANGAFRTADKECFNDEFGRWIFKIDIENTSSSYTKNAADAFLKSRTYTFPKVDFATFNPTQEPGAIYEEEGVLHLNSYDPTPIVKKEGDATPFVDLIRSNFPDGDDAEILLSWMAACVQYPGHKFMWAPVLQGGKGIGKTTITECLKYAVGRRFVVTPKALELGSKFNAWLERALLVVINEMKQDDESEGEVKKLVTDSDIILEAKGRDQRMIRNFANFIFTLNDKQDFRKSKGERRFCVMYSALQEVEDIAQAGMGDAYFAKLQKWLNGDGYAIVAQFLTTYPISEKYNPYTNCLTAPHSSCEQEVSENSISKMEMMLRSAVDDETAGFRNGWICLKRAVELFKYPPDARIIKKHLSNMGYQPHPELVSNGRTDNPIMEEGTKVRLYCTDKVIEETKRLTRPEIVEVYRKGQYL